MKKLTHFLPLIAIFVLVIICALAVGLPVLENYMPQQKCQNAFDCGGGEMCSDKGFCYDYKPKVYNGKDLPTNWEECGTYNAPIVDKCIPHCANVLNSEQFRDEYYWNNCIKNCGITKFGKETFDCTPFKP